MGQDISETIQKQIIKGINQEEDENQKQGNGELDCGNEGDDTESLELE